MFLRSTFLAVRVALPASLSLFVSYLVCAHGVPLLRHDWGFPQLPDALSAAWQTTFQPLLMRGIGEVQGYPTAYLMGFVLWPLSLLPPAAFVWVFVALISALAASGGAAIARASSAGLAAESACALFATLNPWTYTELVAGHVFMIFAYAVLLWLTAEVLRPQPRAPWLVLWSALLVSQIEFLAFAFVPMVIWMLRTRRRSALLALLVAVIPIAFGILAHYATIRSTPFLLEWQTSQSIAILDALSLRGYYAQYAARFDTIAAALWIVTTAAVVATIVSIRRKSAHWILFALGWLAVLIATGTRWIIAPAYSFAVLHVPEIGIWRELYDLLAIAAVAYTASMAYCARLHRVVPLILVASTATLAYAWIASPPFAQFVPQHLVPAQSFPGSQQERIALFPAVQPLKLRTDDGSGFDPDLFYQPGKATPVNSYYPEYPEVRALAAAERGSFSALQALSVRYILTRPYLQENDTALRYTIITPSDTAVPLTQKLQSAYPILGLVSGRPEIVSIGQVIQGNGVFFGDAPAAIYPSVRGTTFRPAVALREGTRAEVGWIDARLAYVRYPELATRFGGAFTRSAMSFAAPERSKAVLAWTDGTLSNQDGKVVARRTQLLRWWPLPDTTRFLRCKGTCVISGFGNPPVNLAETLPRAPVAVTYTMIAPWLIRAAIPEHAESTLRWNVRYEPSWSLIGAPALAHVRLDEDLNAWILPTSSAHIAYLINTSAAAQLILEILSFFTVCFIFWRTARHA